MARKPKAIVGQWCCQCLRDLPTEAFLKLPRGYRVTKCNVCARENMARWQRYVERDPNKIGEVGD